MKKWKLTILSLAALFIGSSAIAQVKQDRKNEAANKKILRYVVEELFNKGDTAIATKYFVPNFAKEEKEFTLLIRKAFPDLKITADIVVAENNIVAARWIATGTHQGVFLGIAPTNKTVTWNGSWFWTFKNGIITDGMGQGSWDALGLLKQLQSK
jgi:predicted ester cyclase